MDKIFRVTSPSGNVSEFFTQRKSASNFIVDEFAMANAFRNADEGFRLLDYLESHDETPNQYPYKYKIEEIKINHEYDDPQVRCMVKIYYAENGTSGMSTQYYDDFGTALTEFERLTNADIEKYGKDDAIVCETSYHKYRRWSKDVPYVESHYDIELIVDGEYNRA